MANCKGNGRTQCVLRDLSVRGDLTQSSQRKRAEFAEKKRRSS